jgi:putative spermidine/putrescine transport system substrate-binding protein
VIVGLLTFMVAFAVGCGDDDDDSGAVDEGEALTELGEGEGEVNLVAWAGYVEDGSTDPKVDWVSDFEKETGCEVNVKIGNTSDEMVQLMRTGQYDAVSASGDATTRLIEGGDVDPVNTDLIPNYEDVYDALKDQQFNSVDGQMYGVPHGRGSNLLMYDPDEVKPAPDSWDVVFDDAGDYSGKVTAYDNPIYIADAALYLREHQPELGIEDPYELDQEQFDAAIELLKEQKQHVGEYWSDYTKEIQAFTNGDSSVGTTWQVINNLLVAEGENEEVVLPEEGATGWSDTWMVSSEAANPNCAYMWLDHIISPEANAAVAEWFGEAPSNEKSCELTSDPKHCEIYHADDEEFFDQIEFWRTPVSDCGDDRGDVCKTYDEWVQGWNEVKG